MRPQPRVRNKKAHELVTTGSPKQSGIPCTMVLTVSFVLSPVTGLSCHRRQQIITCRLDASVGASGPHDFAVRNECRSSARPCCVHRNPAPDVCDDREPPLLWVQDGADHTPDFGFGKTEIFFTGGLDRFSRSRPVGQISDSWPVEKPQKAAITLGRDA
jgi:hypothetical protein